MAAPEKPEQHLTPELLVDYFDHRLSDPEEAEVERHIADCEKCTTLARRTRRLSGAWNTWTAAAHPEALKVQAARGTTSILRHVKPGAVEKKRKSAAKRASH